MERIGSLSKEALEAAFDNELDVLLKLLEQGGPVAMKIPLRCLELSEYSRVDHDFQTECADVHFIVTNRRS